MRLLCYLLLCLGVSGCVKHTTDILPFTPQTSFSGRLLVISPAKRFQVEIDWQADANEGKMRLTHGFTGRVVDVVWQGESMRWLDSTRMQNWQILEEKALVDMGVLLPPWALAQIFSGHMPSTMQTKDNRTWQGIWGETTLKVRWAKQQQRVEIVDIKNGRKAVVIFDE